MRRTVLGLLASGLAALIPGGWSARAATTAQGRILCYVGGYSRKGSPEDNAKGISLFEMDPATGSLSFISVFPDTDNPSFLAISADQRFLYCVNEISDFDSSHSGAVTAFSIDQATGALKKLNRVSSGGADPAHLSIHPSGKYVMVANYTGGSIALFPVRPDGSLGEHTFFYKNSGPKMPERAADNPPGNYAVSDHSGPHAHMIRSDPSGKFVLVCDAGLDRVYIWAMDEAEGKLVPAEVPYISMVPGSAPRHLEFNTRGDVVYILGEQNSRVVVAAFDRTTGRITPGGSTSTVTDLFRGSTLAAGIRLHPNGKYLYVTNRLGNSIAIFDVLDNGGLKLHDIVWERADYGRALAFDPTGQFLFVTNQKSDSLSIFRVNPSRGIPEFTWDFVPVGTPSDVAFIRL
ncbi:lactonase family protein [Acetobacter sp. AN02]|uniref:lactonase family protein n=1 Tax=Acetobacter sp. AN02 TaxID=2894186 RepID=UPI0024341444|nr:lactonase family protein [Acetobacter sp. AN02]MDG6094968.1 lactonase family protein [Acetobacter sp. AN02]